MTPAYIAVEEHWTIQQVLAFIREHGQDSETLNIIYVVDSQGKLIDDIRIRELLLTDPSRRVADLMDRRYVTLKATDDQTTAITEFREHDRTALPVTDTTGSLIGIVTIDDVLDVLEAQTTEDIQRIGGSEALDEPYMVISFSKMVRKRAGWLTALFIGEMLTATAMSAFEAEIERAVVLALFVPLIIPSGGNSVRRPRRWSFARLRSGRCRFETGGVSRGARFSPGWRGQHPRNHRVFAHRYLVRVFIALWSSLAPRRLHGLSVPCRNRSVGAHWLIAAAVHLAATRLRSSHLVGAVRRHPVDVTASSSTSRWRSSSCGGRCCRSRQARPRMDMAHDHTHHGHAGHSHGAPDVSGRVLGAAVALTLAFVVVEATSGWFAHSLALISDAGHNLADAAALGLSWYAIRVAGKRSHQGMTFGYRRVEVFAALINGVSLVMIAAVVAWEAVARIIHPDLADGRTMIVVAAAAIVLNVLISVWLRAASTQNINVRSAYLHMLGDAVAALGVNRRHHRAHHERLWADPVVSLLIAGLIVYTSWDVLRRAPRFCWKDAGRAEHAGGRACHHRRRRRAQRS